MMIPRFFSPQMLLLSLIQWALVTLVGCGSLDDQTLGSLTGVSSSPAETREPTRLKVFRRTGSASVGAISLAIGDQIDLRAVLIDSTGTMVTEIPAQWWTTGTLRSQDLTVTGGTPGKYATYTAGAVGNGAIQAAVSDAALIEQYNITGTQTVTGQVTSSLALVPDSILIVSGNSQSGQVGTNLAQPLVVRVVNAANVPVPGASVTFAVSNGGGSILTAQPVATDADGEAAATVRLGGQVGSGVHSFTATINTGSSTQVSFTATGTPGPAARLNFHQQPGGANAGSTFSTQPVISIQDSYGNRVTSSTDTVTLTLATGAGTLGGALSVNAVAGLATFTNVSYSASHTGVSITANSGSLTSVTSAPFDVGSIITAAQCAVEGGGWASTDAGCKDISSGLVWSAISASTMTWHQAVWDSASSGSEAPEAWEVAKGITHDYDVSQAAPIVTDSHASSYCHSLVESGATDWRLPTSSEASAAWTNGGPTALKNVNLQTWTASQWDGTDSRKSVRRISDNNNTVVGATSFYYARCVRRPAPTKLVFTTQPAAATRGFGVNVPFQTQPVVKIQDSTNSVDTSSNVAVTIVAVGGTGTLLGTTTVTAVNGVATFTNLAYDKPESIQLRVSSSGLTSATSVSITINQTYPYAQCKAVGGSWIQARGGCKDLTTGLVWGSLAPTAMTWHDAIWDVAGPGNTGTEDDDDNGRTDDYDPLYPHLGGTDASTTNYCHSLRESGMTDWRMPAFGEITGLSGKMTTTYITWDSTISLMSSSTVSGTPASVYRAVPSSGGTGSTGKTSAFMFACVRRDPPTQLAFITQPGGGANGFGAGVTFLTAPVVQLRDADGAPFPITSSITLTVVGGTGNLWMNGANQGQSVTVATTTGSVTFSGLMYDRPGETIVLRASMPSLTWNGNVINIPTLDSTALVFPTLYLPSRCASGASGWVTQYGGCRDQGAGGLVWSSHLGTATWHQAIWDSAVFGAGAPDVYDAGRTNDYDNSPLTVPDNVPSDICHSLKLNGYDDWRMPTQPEATVAVPRLIGNNLSGWTAGETYWTSTTHPTVGTDAYHFSWNSSASYTTTTTAAKSGVRAVRCVRPATP